MFKHPFSFNGRIRRTEFGLSYLILNIIAFIIELALDSDYNNGLKFLLMLLIFVIIWLILSQSAKRCHDLGNSGWYQIIPFYGLWLLFSDSDRGPNEYGLNPKGIDNPEPENDEIDI